MYCTVTNTPAKKKSMTKVERSYLENNLEDHGPIRKNSNSVPWVAMVIFYQLILNNAFLSSLLHRF